MKKNVRTMLGLGAGLMTVLLSGCGVSDLGKAAAPSTPAPVAGIGFAGSVYGGQQPVAGVQIQLYAAGTGGYGMAASPLLPAGSVLTNANGQFRLPSFACPSDSSLVYLVGTGGQPIAATQSAPAVTNANLAMMVAIGPCSSITASTFLAVNELTTVASVWALQQFMTGPANVSTSASNVTGLQNAFNIVNNVVDTGSGKLPGPALPANALLPTTELNTLADIVAGCVNTGGGAASASGGDGSICGTLFFNAPNAAGSTYPTDTITAALNIARNPARNVAALNGIANPQAPFQPTLSAAPTAWTVTIGYKPASLNQAGDLAADQAGNVWITDSQAQGLVIVANNGAVVSGSAELAQNKIALASSIAIDQNGVGWMIARQSNAILRVDSSGNAMTVTGGGLNAPRALAIDGMGQVWVTGGTGTISGFTNAGAALASAGFSGAGANSYTIAIQSH